MSDEEQATRKWGGARPGAGRPSSRKSELDAGELRLFRELLLNSLHAKEYADTVEKLSRMLGE